MRSLHVKKTSTIFAFILLGTFTVLEANSDAVVQCQQSKKEYVKAESKWSALYTEESFLQDELKRLGNIARDVKSIVDILNTAQTLLETDGKMSKTETATLNVRVPKDRGVLYPDGSFAITGHKAKSLKESLKILDHIAKWADKGVTQVQGNIAYIHPQISQIHKKVSLLEDTIERICTQEMGLAMIDQEHTTANDQEIVNRFAKREQQRYEEVSNRRWGDIERAWVNRYYNTCRFRPCHPIVGVPY